MYYRKNLFDIISILYAVDIACVRYGIDIHNQYGADNTFVKYEAMPVVEWYDA